MDNDPLKIRSLHESRYLLDRGDLIGCMESIAQLPGELQQQIEARHLRARACSQGGQPDEARAILHDILRSDKASPMQASETWSLIGRTWKDTWQQTKPHAVPDDVSLKEAINAYKQALQISSGDYYAAVNLATLNLIAGQEMEAQLHAKLVINLCTDATNRWALASRAEAHAVLGNNNEALRDYSEYARLSKGEIRDLSSTRRQARIVAGIKSGTRHLFDDVFDLPSIVVFSGHRVDAPGRARPRLPLAALDALKLRILSAIREMKAGIGYSSAACGSDILFLESMNQQRMEVGGMGETNIVLSSPRECFRINNIENSPNPECPMQDWSTRFDLVLEEATRSGSVAAASPHPPDDEALACVYCNLVMSGQAALRAKALDLDLKPLAVWNGGPGDGPGGTCDFVQNWLRIGYSPRIIHPQEMPESRTCEVGNAKYADTLTPVVKGQIPSKTFRQEIKAILFADVKNFSKLSEVQLRHYIHHYLGCVSKLIANSSDQHHHGPLVCNTWGDAFYMVFESADEAGSFALKLRNALAPPPDGNADWVKCELPKDLNIRIALHAGPVLFFPDPILRAMSFTGRHVSFAARLEPVTPTGQIYSSEAFAAMAAMEAVTEFRCDYVGVIQAAKDFGFVRAYRVQSTALNPL